MDKHKSTLNFLSNNNHCYLESSRVFIVQMMTTVGSKPPKSLDDGDAERETTDLFIDPHQTY